MSRRMMSAVRVPAALLLCSLVSCISGRIMVTPVKIERADVPRTTLTVGVRGVPRARVNAYQGELERDVVRALSESGMFVRVLTDYAPEDVDLELRIQPATLWFTRYVSTFGLVSSVATLGVWTFSNGRIAVDVQRYELGVEGYRPDGTRRFSVAVEHNDSHGLGMWSWEYSAGVICRGSGTRRALRELVEAIGEELGVPS